ncbi:MAG: 6-bladed beta-propeller [Candidatus Aminicenantales bacterium]
MSRVLLRNVSCILLMSLGVVGSGRGQEVITKEEVTFGKGATFSEVGSIALDTRNNLYVLDNRACDVKVFAGQGNFRGTIGKKGQGPGELFVPVSMEINKKDEIIVYCLGNHRISLFHTDGKLIREFSTAKLPRLFSIRYVADGIFVGYVSYYYGENKIDELLVVDENMETKARIAKLEKRSDNRGIEVYAPLIRYSVIGEREILWGNWLDDKVFISDTHGDIRETIPLQFKSREITDSDKALIIKTRFEDQEPEQEVIFPKYFPRFFSLLVSGDDIFFLTSERGTPAGHYYYLLKRGDKTFRKIFLNPDPVIFRDGTYYSTSEDDQGNPVVKRIRYQIKKPQ